MISKHNFAVLCSSHRVGVYSNLSEFQIRLLKPMTFITLKCSNRSMSCLYCLEVFKNMIITDMTLVSPTQEYMESLPPNINDMWMRFKERNEQSASESSLNSTRLDALSGLITNPTQRAVTSCIKVTETVKA